MQRTITVNLQEVVLGGLAIIAVTIMFWIMVSSMYWTGDPEKREKIESKIISLERINNRTEFEQRMLDEAKDYFAPAPTDWYNPIHLPGGALFVGSLGFLCIIWLLAKNIDLGKWRYVRCKEDRYRNDPKPTSAIG